MVEDNARWFPLVYAELHRLAESYMRGERKHHTLQPTALVNEAFVKLAAGSGEPAIDRTRFLGVAARTMRQVLVEHARRRDTAKRGGQRERVGLESLSLVAGDSASLDLLAVHEALEQLSLAHLRPARVAELRLFAGLTIAEAAVELSVSHTTVEEDWAFARTWLARALALDERS